MPFLTNDGLGGVYKFISPRGRGFLICIHQWNRKFLYRFQVFAGDF